MQTAILVDGGFYRKRAASLWGHKTPERRASELMAYCQAHLKYVKAQGYGELYRIFYYDCPPISKKVYHPLKKQTVDFEKTETYQWTNTFLEELKKQRKVALRLGKISDEHAAFRLNRDRLKKLCTGAITIDELQEEDFSISFSQKGVDMKIGIDIASLSFKKQVSQIILIAGDSDFVPAAKLARREGIDFVLDPMWANIKDELHEHIDGLQSQWKKKRRK